MSCRVQGQVVTNDAVADVHTSISLASAHTRLLIITGIPALCDADSIKHAIRHVAKPAGARSDTCTCRLIVEFLVMVSTSI